MEVDPLKKKKRILSLLLCIATLVSLIPTTSFAAGVCEPALEINQSKVASLCRAYMVGDRRRDQWRISAAESCHAFSRRL